MEPTHDSRPDPGSWSLSKRVLFRFGLLYFLLYSHPFPLHLIPNPATIAAIFEWEWAWTAHTQEWFFDYLGRYMIWVRDTEFALIDWTASSIFGLTHDLVRPLGSGDPTHSYVRLVVHAALAAVGCLAWTLVAIRRWSHHRLLGAWALLGLRFYLALIMLGYGLAKVFPVQFRFPDPTRLLAAYGDSSPMNVLWSFMGSSAAYTMFAGAGEVLGGVLLLFRRTATLGALVTIGVMTNVVAMNFCYDVPVKLYSSHIVLFACCMCAPDLRRLLNVLVLNRPAVPRDLTTPRLPVVGLLAMVLVIGTRVSLSVSMNAERHAKMQDKSELYGIWDVERYAVGGESVPPLTTDPVRWQNLVVGHNPMMKANLPGTVRGMDGTRRGQSLRLSEDGKTLTVTAQSVWHYRLEDPDTLVFEGEFQRRFKKHPRAKTSADNPVIRRDPQVAIHMRRRRADVEAVDAGHRKEAAATQVPIGTWEVVETKVLGEFFTPRRRSDPSGWKTLVIQPGGKEALVEHSNGRVDELVLQVDVAATSATLSTRATLAVERPSADALILRGDYRGHQLEVELRRRDLNEFMLVRRGFNWINETPFNRF